MSTDGFEVILTGEALLGEDFEAAWAAFVAQFRLDAHQADVLLMRLPASIKRDVDRETAERYAERIRAIGLVANVARQHQEAVLVEPVVAPAGTGEAAAGDGWSLAPLDAEGAMDDERKVENIHEISPHFTVVDTLPHPTHEVQQPLMPRHVAFGFSGNGAEYFRIWIVNLLLSIVTLGVYSAWAKVRRLTYFHGNTWLGDSNFGYHAKPLQILKGRVIAFILFVALAFGSEISPAVGLFSAALFFAAFPWMFWTSMRFGANNTSYRNIRFGFRGDLKGAYAALLGWPLLGMLSFGLLFPLAMHKGTAYTVNNYAYGTSRFSFDASVGSFYGLFGKYLGLFVLLMVVFFGGVVGGTGAMASLLGIDPETLKSGDESAVGKLVIVPMTLFYVGFFVLYAWYQTRIRNLVVNHTQVEGHVFHSRYSIGSYISLQLGNWLGIVLSLGLFIPWAAVRTARYAAERTDVQVAGDLDSFVADQTRQQSALGQEMGDMFDADISLI